MGRPYPVTLGVAILCLLAFGLTGLDDGYNLLTGSGRRLPLALALGAVQRQAVEAGQWWRLLTAGFLHFSLMHLLLNMWSLWFAGRYCEPRYGSGRFVVIYLVALLGGDALAFATSLPRTSTAGASGAVMGAFGAMLWLGMRYRGERPQFAGAFVPVAATLLNGLVNSGVSNAAHVGGLVAGFLTAWLLGPSPAWAAGARAQEEAARSARAARSPAVEPPPEVVADPANRIELRSTAGIVGPLAWGVVGASVVALAGGNRLVALAGIALLLLGGLLALSAGRTRLVLTPLGFTLHGLTPARTVRWHDVDGFYLPTAEAHYARAPQVGYRLAPGGDGPAAFLSGDLRSIPVSFGMSPEQQAYLLESWRARWAGTGSEAGPIAYHGDTLTKGSAVATEIPGLVRGLEGVIAAPTAICDLDGLSGTLAYGGYDIAELASEATFEETVYLLWEGELPTRVQLERLTADLSANRAIPPQLIESMRLYPRPVNSMAALRAAVAQLGLYDAESEALAPEALRRIAVRLTAQIPTVVAACQRIQEGAEPIAPRPDLGHAANFLYMLSGREPRPEHVRAMDVSLILYAEHEMNASSFGARVAASTLSDMYSAVVAGIATIKGPLHGGAGEAVMRDLEEIGSLDNVEPFATRALAAKRRFMGFGHRVYKNGDPRATILAGMADRATAQAGDRTWYEMSVKLHEVVNREKGLHPNVDFYSASLFAALGIPAELNVPIITVARIAGWSAQLFEQYADNRIFRPRAAYVGPARRRLVPLDRRG